VIHETLPNKIKFKNNATHFFLLDSSGFFLKGRYYYAFIVQKVQKNSFF
jgi:hypothetical protein